MASNEIILLVEDDPAAVKIAMHAFDKSGMDRTRMTVAKDGQEALDILFGEETQAAVIPRLVLLDLKLPKVDGLDVLKRIRRENATRNVPVIVLTNSDEESDIDRGYELGVNSYLNKPVDFRQLIKLLEQLDLLPG